jgi:hypothetical protein
MPGHNPDTCPTCLQGRQVANNPRIELIDIVEEEPTVDRASILGDMFEREVTRTAPTSPAPEPYPWRYGMPIRLVDPMMGDTASNIRNFAMARLRLPGATSCDVALHTVQRGRLTGQRIFRYRDPNVTDTWTGFATLDYNGAVYVWRSADPTLAGSNLPRFLNDLMRYRTLWPRIRDASFPQCRPLTRDELRWDYAEFNPSFTARTSWRSGQLTCNGCNAPMFSSGMVYCPNCFNALPAGRREEEAQYVTTREERAAYSVARRIVVLPDSWSMSEIDPTRVM